MDPMLEKILAVALAAGPFGTVLMSIMWWLERAERRELQKTRDALLERTLTSITSVTEAIRENAKAILLAVSGRGGPNARD